jgi:hypothetical protein
MSDREIPQDLVDRVHDILKEHVGENDPIHSQTIARLLNIGDEAAGTPSTRAVITQLLRQGVAVGATPQGYFLIANGDELERYCADLQRRQDGIEARILAVRRAFVEGPVPRGQRVRWIPTDAEEM